MGQTSFMGAEYAGAQTDATRGIPAEMDQAVLWQSLPGTIEPFYPEAGRRRHPYPLAAKLRIHLMQNWFGAMSAITGIRLSGRLPASPEFWRRHLRASQTPIREPDQRKECPTVSVFPCCSPRAGLIV